MVYEVHLRTGNTYTNPEICRTFDWKNQGGIRYSGRFPNIASVGIFLAETPSSIYPDVVEKDGTITYSGEGQRGDQRLAAGNKVLVWLHYQGQTLHAFQRLSKNRYRYLGEFRIARVAATAEPDASRRVRGAFSFTLTRA